MRVKACHLEFDFPRPAMVMGVVNVTPDSFSDGGECFDSSAAVDRALELEGEGAEIIDVGGESTRPRAEPVSESEELRRVLPVIEQLAGRLKAAISIDTRKPRVAREALAAGAVLVNDIEANRKDPEMWHVVAKAGAAYVMMHMQGTPQTMQEAPQYTDVVAEVGSFFRKRLATLRREGIGREQVLLDVGIGFGKTLEHNLELLSGLKSFTKLKRPLLLGVSRKSFMGRLLNAGIQERVPAGLACACWAVLSGVQIIRTHDVWATKQCLQMMEAIVSHQKVR